MDYHNDRYEDASLLVFKKDDLIAVLPANRVKQKIYAHQGLSYGGLILKEHIKFSDVLHCFSSVLRYLNENDISELEIKTIPRIYNRLPSDELDYLLFLTEAQGVRCDVSSVIDNSNRIEISSSNRKRGLARAINNNLIVKEVDELSEFWNHVLIPNLKQRHGVDPTHSLEEITLLKQRFPNQIRQFNVLSKNAVVAGVTIFETDKVAHVQYISANEQKQELGSLDLLIDELINSVFKDKSYFDFGISNENKGRNINEGLLNWKEDFGARSIVQNFHCVQTKNFSKLNNIML
jgi:hypothetical protein